MQLPETKRLDTPYVDRVEVIDDTGRVLVRYGVRAVAVLQDDGRTLKVFLARRETA